MTVPPHSNIARIFSKMQQRSAHFKDVLHNGDILLVPFRYVKYFAEDANTSMMDILEMLVHGCLFRPRLLPVHCEFFFYSELYQLLCVEGGKGEARSLFEEFLSDLEGVEFYWIGGLRGLSADGKMEFQANPSLHIPKLFLETALNCPSPKLDTLCIRMYGHQVMPSIDSCLVDIAPFLSSCPKDGETLPISAPYSGLRKIHVFGEIKERASGDIISSIVLHQEVMEGLEIRCNSKVISPGDILDPIFHILTQPSLQFLVVKKWRDYDFKELFYKFLEANAHCKISFATSSEEVVIPVRQVENPDVVQQSKVLHFLPSVADSSYMGIVFAWLEEAKMDFPLHSITILSAFTSRKNEQCVLSRLTTCRVLTLQVKGTRAFPFSGCFAKLSCNKTLEVLQIHGCMPFVILIDNFCEMLSALYTNCAGSLTELSLLSNRIGSLPPDKLELFFRTLVSAANPGQLSVNLRGNGLKDTALDLLLKVWRATKKELQFKSLLLDSPEQEERVSEMVLLEW
jgi:hypothetical protein